MDNTCPACGREANMVPNQGKAQDWYCPHCKWQSWLSTSPVFHREDRYLIFKRTDLAAAGLSKLECIALEEICDKIAEARRKRKGNNWALRAVVVEDDWPEYEQVWKMIERRVEDANDSK